MIIIDNIKLISVSKRNIAIAYMLSKDYLDGTNNKKRDSERVLHYLHLAVDLNNHNAEYLLAQLYSSGRILKQNNQK